MTTAIPTTICLEQCSFFLSPLIGGEKATAATQITIVGGITTVVSAKMTTSNFCLIVHTMAFGKVNLVHYFNRNKLKGKLTAYQTFQIMGTT